MPRPQAEDLPDGRGWLTSASLTPARRDAVGVCIESVAALNTGYLEIRALERLKVLYVATEGEEVGWVYACRQHCAETHGETGWVPAAAIAALVGRGTLKGILPD